MLSSRTLDRLKAHLDSLRPLAPEQEQRVLQKFRLRLMAQSQKPTPAS